MAIGVHKPRKLRDKGNKMNLINAFNEAFFNSQWRETINYEDEVVQILKDVGNKLGESVCYINLGIAYRNLGDLNKAIEYQEKALKINKEIDNRNGEAYCYANLGAAYHGLGILNKAIEFYEKALEIANDTGDKELESKCHNNLHLVNQTQNSRKTIVYDGNEVLEFVNTSNNIDPRNLSNAFNKEGKMKTQNLLNRDKIFINYSHSNKSIVEPFVKGLVRNGVNIYFDSQEHPKDDPHSLAVGLSEGLSQCNTMLSFISQNYLTSKWCCSELREFIYFFAREWGSLDLPIVMIYLEEGISDNEIFEIISSNTLKNALYQVLADPINTNRSDIDQIQHKKVLRYVKNRKRISLELIRPILKYNLSSKNQDRCLDHITTKIKNIQNELNRVKKISKSSYSDNEDLDLLWDYFFSTYGGNSIKYSGTSTERIKNALVSHIQRTEKSPSLDDVEELWKYIWTQYKHKTIAEDIDIKFVLNKFVPLEMFNPVIIKNVDKYSDAYLLAIYKGIANKEHNIQIFDRPYTESSMYYNEWSDNILSQQKHLRPRVLKGHPIDLLIGDTQRRTLLPQLQYSYYYYLKEESQNVFVDIAVIAGLLINIDMWFEVLRNIEDFNDLIIKSLSTGRDIRSIFP